MKILVTGGAGFIGQHTVFELAESGHEVSIFDKKPPSDWIPSGCRYFRGELEDKSTLKEAVKNQDAIVHLGAMSRSGPSIQDWRECLDTNIQGTSNLMEVAADSGLKKIVYAASATFYGLQPAPNRIGDSPDYLNFYSLSKSFGESLALQFDRHFGLEVTPLRYFSVYGPGQPSEGAYGLVIGIFLRNLASGVRSVIFGDGTQRRDFIHVSDIARANRAAIESDFHGAPLNVGSGVNFSIQEVADLIGVEYDFVPERVGDALETLADISETTKQLKWVPEVNFDQGIRELLQIQKISGK